MKMQSFNFIVGAMNIVLILFIAARSQKETFEKITVKEFEMVDQNGKRRASIKVEPDGEVVFRLTDQGGNIRVKLGGGRDGSGIVLLDDETNVGVHVVAKKDKAFISVTGKDGKKREY
ncbi:MAG: hypothetical protein QM734_07260 [Cyclobacteriaceae bacterium]